MASSETHAAELERRPRRFGVACVCGVLGIALIVFGWLIPSQFKSLPASVLGMAGANTTTLAAAVRQHLDAGRPGPAAVIAQAAALVHAPTAEAIAERVKNYAEENPDLALWGEANPHLTNALGPAVLGSASAAPAPASAPWTIHAAGGDAAAAPAARPPAGILHVILPAKSRRGLSEYLAGSRNAGARAVLATRELKSYRQFLPVFSAGGAPLESTILLAAMLVQTDQLGEGAAQQLRALAENAVASGEAAQLETVYLDLLALGRRYNWGQLTALTRGAESLDALAKLRHLHQVAGESAPVIASAAMLSRRPEAVSNFVIRFGEHGAQALGFALFHGQGSLDLLLRQDLPVDGDLTVPPLEDVGGIARKAVDPLVRFSLQDPSAAVAAKFGAYLLGGLLLFIAVENITALRRLELSRPITFVTRSVGALVVCLLLIVFNEPYLALGSEPTGYTLKLVFPVIGADTVSSMNPSSTGNPIDQATLVSIGFFFLLQVLVYLICLLKLREIQGKALPSLLKLRLVENEENLFDSGLYVGIAGTSVALVLQVLQVIEANLLAAYSSNLFGILCVAFVKIRHVRVFKQKLIEEMNEQTVAATPAPAVQPQPARG